MASRRQDRPAFWRDSDGAALTEALIVMTVLLLMVAAFIELSFAVNQWNLAVKAVQQGARLASVSTPVDTGLKAFTGLATANPGDPSPGYSATCSNGTCTGSGNIAHGYSAAAMNRLIRGGDTSCAAPYGGALGMCDIFPGMLRGGTVTVSYTFAGLGYAGRPGGPVPVIQITLQNVQFPFLLLGAFLGQAGLTLPAFTVTAIGEDLSSGFP